MITRKETASEIEYITTLRAIMETYEEIASSRMQRIRSSVLQTRGFIMEINSIFQEVKSSYRKEVEILMKKKKIRDPSKLTFISKNKKTLSVLLSANTGLYGDVVRRTFDVFSQRLRKESDDAAIVGRLGYALFRQEFPKRQCAYFELADDKIDEIVLKQALPFLVQYEKVIIFYPQFKNIIVQTPMAVDMSGDMLPSQGAESEIKYFFEPSLEKILEFFEKEIFGSIVQQLVNESQLSKFAARMVTLDNALDNTKKRLKETIFLRERIRHQALNKKQMENFASISLWQK